MEIPTFKNKADKIKFLVDNKDVLIAQKKGAIKYADGISFVRFHEGNKNEGVYKANVPIDNAPPELKVSAVINTTNLMDSHDDVHMPGIWTKSLKENRRIMHLQEHKMAFDAIISDGNDLTAKAVDMSWKELGFKFDGQTQALIFDSVVRQDRNKYMHEQYAKGRVTNHSVGMQYVKIFLAVNDEDYDDEYAMWNKYYDKIANKEVADSTGYFWAVTEAKVIEGSAVPIGSNFATPTLENNKSDDTTYENKESLEKHSNIDVNEFKDLLKESLSWMKN